MASIDPRLRAAVDASLCWYDALCALHEVGCSTVDGVWAAHRTPPPLHSAVKTAEPWASTGAAVQALRGVEHGSIADSFGRLEPPGMDLLFEARWILRAPAAGTWVIAPGWTRVVTQGALTRWNHLSGTTGVLLPAMLHRPEFTVLASSSADEPAVMVAGAVLHLAGDVLSLSNVWSIPGHDLDWSELLALAWAIHPGRAVAGYARGPGLEQALEAGFADVGPQAVWAR